MGLSRLFLGFFPGFAFKSVFLVHSEPHGSASFELSMGLLVVFLWFSRVLRFFS